MLDLHTRLPVCGGGAVGGGSLLASETARCTRTISSLCTSPFLLLLDDGATDVHDGGVSERPMAHSAGQKTNEIKRLLVSPAYSDRAHAPMTGLDIALSATTGILPLSACVHQVICMPYCGC